MKNHWIQQRKLKAKPTITFGLFDGTNYVVNCEVGILHSSDPNRIRIVSSDDNFVAYFKSWMPNNKFWPAGLSYKMNMDAFICVHVNNVLKEVHDIRDVYLWSATFYMTGLHATNNIKLAASIVIESPQIANIKSSYIEF